VSLNLSKKDYERLVTQISQTKTVLRQVNDLMPYARNSRKHEDWQVAQLAASIKEFGFRSAILTQEDGTIIAGHARVMAALKLNLPEVPCIVVDGLTKAQIQALVIADNKHALNASWDDEMLANELREISIEEPDFDFGSIGYSDEELAGIFEDNETKEGLTDPDAVPDVDKNIFNVERGDIWILGEHRLMCGDSTSKDDVDNLMPSINVDVTFTSPPYNAAKNSHMKEFSDAFSSKYENTGDDLSNDDFVDFLNKSFELSMSKSKWVFWNMQLLAHNKLALLTWLSNYKEKIKDILIWNKKIAPPNIVKGAFNTKFEFVFCFSNDYAETRAFPAEWRGQYPNVIETENNSGNENAETHRAGFPVAFPLWFIEKLDCIQSVYEPFCGTGTTIIACEKTNRKCYGMEIDPHYCSVIIKRWQDFTGKTAVKAS
jgi:DNA modification methylase